MRLLLVLIALILPGFIVADSIQLGIDRVFDAPISDKLKGQKIGLITNQTGVNSKLQKTINLFYAKQNELGYELRALFGPEHGIYGDHYAGEHVASTTFLNTIPIYSLHGQTRRPTDEMLKDITLLVFDIQDIGSRPYTYTSTLFYCMEEAAKKNIAVMVLDRPNPINGTTVDGPMLEPEFRTFLGYCNVAYCHGMTIGELALFFNEQYNINCTLHIVAMNGWKRWMSFQDTGLIWIPTSPNVTESTTCAFFPATGMLGEMYLTSIGIGYTLPFKVVGAPWIEASRFSQALNAQHLRGVVFHDWRFRPFMYRFAATPCQGTLIAITDQARFLPVTTQFLILSVLKELYPKQTIEVLKSLQQDPKNFYKVCGTKAVLDILLAEAKPFSRLTTVHKAERERFLQIRKKYLIPEYS